MRLVNVRELLHWVEARREHPDFRIEAATDCLVVTVDVLDFLLQLREMDPDEEVNAFLDEEVITIGSRK